MQTEIYKEYKNLKLYYNETSKNHCISGRKR